MTRPSLVVVSCGVPVVPNSFVGFSMFFGLTNGCPFGVNGTAADDDDSC